MKNKRIVDSWSKIEPDNAADARMLDVILARSHSGRTEKERVFTLNRTFNWKRLAPIAACLVLIVAVTAVIGSNANWFQSRVYTEILGEDGRLNFYQSSVLGADRMDFGIDVISRDLTANENKELFGELAVTTSYGMFNAGNKSLLHVEAKVANTKIILAAPWLPTTDTVIDMDTEVSTINGVPVSAGYFVTNKNSEGISNIIYFASFILDDISIYVELGDVEAAGETIRGEITSVIKTIIQNGTPNFSKVAA